MSDEQSRFWARHYDALAVDAAPWLDYSNERVQAQTFALALEALGPVGGRRCLDVGCGFGRLSAVLSALGASSVCGLDQSAVMIARNRERHPQLRWIAGQARDLPAEEFDLVLAIEVLQYVPIAETLCELWRRVAAGGRLVAVVPSRDCPLVQRAMARFEGQFLPPTMHELGACASGLERVSSWAVRGMAFATDQRVAPYVAGEWTQVPPGGPPPNRLELVIAKAASEPERPATP